MTTSSRKRAHSHVDPNAPTNLSSKRQRFSNPDHLSALSDELLLRILHHLTVPQLLACQSLSHRIHHLAGDPQLWKALYHTRFILPRALRLPGPRRPSILSVTSKKAAWLGEQHLVAPGSQTNWQRQYKLRHNWARGDCSIEEVRIAEQQPTPRTLIQVCEDLVVTAAREQGIRVWRLEDGTARLRETYGWAHWGEGLGEDEAPSAMAAEASGKGKEMRVVVGTTRGRLRVYRLDKETAKVELCLEHRLPEEASATAMSLAAGFLSVLTSLNVLHVYHFGVDGITAAGSMKAPSLLTTLSSRSVWSPASLTMRVGSIINVSVAYALPQYLSGWSVGLQELQLGLDGTLLKTRVATAANQAFIPISSNTSNGRPTGISENVKRPTGLSLNHPYILTSHSDNTLTLHLVRTTDTELDISRGRKLWGHTSSVSAVHVGPRGKAVSVGIHGNEIRVWELEGSHKLSLTESEQGSVRVRSTPSPAEPRTRTADFTEQQSDLQSEQDRGPQSDGAWVGFDDERLLVLRESDDGCEALMIYDFSN